MRDSVWFFASTITKLRIVTFGLQLKIVPVSFEGKHRRANACPTFQRAYVVGSAIYRLITNDVSDSYR